MKWIITFFLTVFICNAGEYTRNSDSLELIKLYNSTNGDNWRHKEGWDGSLPVNKWFGIEIDTIQQGQDEVFVVKKIYLQSNKLSGELPELNFENLEVLYLSGNKIEGDLPELSTPNLRILYIPGNKLSGTFSDFSFSNIEVIDLSGNSLSGEIPELNYSNLRLINISYNQLTGSIPDFNCPELESIYLSDNKLTGSVPDFNLEKLRILNLKNNRLTGSITNFELPSATNIDLSRNELSGNIPQIRLENLEQLNLSHNDLTGSVPNVNCPNLKNLSLYNNNLSGSIFLDKTLHLETIKIYNNKVSNLADLSQLTKLNTLNIRNNKLTFEDIEKNMFIPDFDYSEQDTLLPVELTREGNEFTLRVIASGINNEYQWQLNGADVVDENFETLTGTENGTYKCKITNTEVPGMTLYTKLINTMKVIYALKSDSLELVKFYTDTDGENWKRNDNWLTENLIIHWKGIEADTIVIEGDSLLVVKSLRLGNNGLSGEFPDINLPYLEYMDFFNNNFEGNLRVVSHPNLKSIDISNNNLSGELSDLYLPNIEFLDISNNEFVGEIPNYDFTNIEYLDYSGNYFEGGIPEFQYPKIDLLDLSNNQLSGEIPKFDFPLLTDLNLEYNELSGCFPDMDIPEIMSISISGNMICDLPDLKKYKSLDFFSADNNKLTFEDIELNIALPYFNYGTQDTILPVYMEYVDGNVFLKVIAKGIANRYQWRNFGNNVYKANGDTLIVPYELGEYKCKITNILAVDLSLYSQEVNPLILDINGEGSDIKDDVLIYPNPANHYINIEFNFQNDNAVELFISDINGRLLNVNPMDKNDCTVKIDLTQLGAGEYHLIIVTEKRSYLRRFVIFR